MAYATYQKQRVVEAAETTAKRYRSRIEEHYREENERKEKRIQEAMKARWWRGPRTRDKAAMLVESDELALS